MADVPRLANVLCRPLTHRRKLFGYGYAHCDPCNVDDAQ